MSLPFGELTRPTLDEGHQQLAHIGTYALPERVDEGAHIAGYALADWPPTVDFGLHPPGRARREQEMLMHSSGSPLRGGVSAAVDDSDYGIDCVRL